MRQNIFPTYFPWIHSGNEAKYGPLSLVNFCGYTVEGINVNRIRQVCLIRKPFNTRQCLFSARTVPKGLVFNDKEIGGLTAGEYVDKGRVLARLYVPPFPDFTLQMPAAQAKR